MICVCRQFFTIALELHYVTVSKVLGLTSKLMTPMKANKPYIKVEKNTLLSAINRTLFLTPSHTSLALLVTVSLVKAFPGDQDSLCLELLKYLHR